jgi:hypothetical protein
LDDKSELEDMYVRFKFTEGFCFRQIWLGGNINFKASIICDELNAQKNVIPAIICMSRILSFQKKMGKVPKRPKKVSTLGSNKVKAAKVTKAKVPKQFSIPSKKSPPPRSPRRGRYRPPLPLGKV